VFLYKFDHSDSQISFFSSATKRKNRALCPEQEILHRDEEELQFPSIQQAISMWFHLFCCTLTVCNKRYSVCYESIEKELPRVVAIDEKAGSSASAKVPQGTR